MNDLTERREKFRDRMRGLFAKHGVKPLADDGPLGDDMVILVTLAADFKLADNEIWEDPANHSIPRDLFCRKCRSQVVMSHGMFKAYTERAGRPYMILCIGCLATGSGACR